MKYAQEKRIDLFALDSWGLTPFENACKWGSVSAVSILLNYFQEKSIKWWDRKRNAIPLIAVGMKVEEWCCLTQRWLVWHEGMYEARLIIAEILIKYFKKTMDLFAKDSSGRNPFHHACASGSIDLVHLLLKHFNFDVNARDVNGRTALHYACCRTWGLKEVTREGPAGYPAVVEFLLSKKEELGLDPSIEDNRGMTPRQAVEAAMPKYLRVSKNEMYQIFDKYGIYRVIRTSKRLRTSK